MVWERLLTSSPTNEIQFRHLWGKNKREELLAALNRVIERHPRTIFIGAHLANNAEELAAKIRKTLLSKEARARANADL